LGLALYTMGGNSLLLEIFHQVVKYMSVMVKSISGLGLRGMATCPFPALSI